MEPSQNPKPSQSQSEASTAFQRWEYRVVHVNINNDAPPQPPTPEAASQKLQGSLSPEFIQREFPQMYQKQSVQQQHPAAQLQDFLNRLGNEGWELVETSQVGGLLMFFFKRLRSVQPDATTDQPSSERGDNAGKIPQSDKES
ncbi:MAG: hypothetical protein ACON4T_09655 [Synechococcus sp.]